MTFTAFLFYFFAGLQIFSAISMITVKNPVNSVLFLILAFVCGSGLWLLLEAEFLGIALVLVYVGAVMVLFLFVVMMLDIDVAAMRAEFAKYLGMGIVAALVMAGVMIMVLQDSLFEVAAPEPKPANYSNTEDLASVLYTEHVYAFELAAVVLLVAMVAAIALTYRRRPGTKHQKIHDQVSVRREDRVRLVNLKSEGK